MGGWLSSYWGYADDDQVDPGSGLTKKQKRLVTETWAILHREPLKLGINFMTTNMGSWFSFYWGYTDDDQIDPGCGLTEKQKRLVTKSWRILHREPLKLGITLMQAFFTKHPEYQSLFLAFKDVPIKDLPNNKRFQAHASSIVSALDSTIGSLKDPGLLEAMLLTLGEKHHKRGQTQKQFNDLRVIVVTSFEEVLGSRWTPDVNDAWKAALDAVYGIIFRAL